MLARLAIASLILLPAGSLIAADTEYTSVPVKEAPQDLPAPIAAKVDPAGFQVKSADGAVCSIWLLKTNETDPAFTPTLNVKYPFKNGQLLGVLEVAEDAKFTDFRGQEIDSGVYTLRYGQQPMDGNHIGTSEVSDFLLALPLKQEKGPEAIESFDDLTGRSAEAAGATHPAIFSLLSAEDEVEPGTLTHDEDRELWILSLEARKGEDGAAEKLPIRLVVIGQSEG